MLRFCALALVLLGAFIAAPVAMAAPDCVDFWNNDRLDGHQKRWCQALAFKQKYLANGNFVKQAPSGDGKAIGVKSSLRSHFSSSGTSQVTGTVSLEELRGRFRLKLASTNDTLYYGRQIKVSGTVSTKKGALEIYSPIDVDLWKLAAVLVDGSDRNAPPPEDGLVLQGYVVTQVAAGVETDFSPNLLAIGGQFLLLLHAPNGGAQQVHIVLKDD